MRAQRNQMRRSVDQNFDWRLTFWKKKHFVPTWFRKCWKGFKMLHKSFILVREISKKKHFFRFSSNHSRWFLLGRKCFQSVFWTSDRPIKLPDTLSEDFEHFFQNRIFDLKIHFFILDKLARREPQEKTCFYAVEI